MPWLDCDGSPIWLCPKCDDESIFGLNEMHRLCRKCEQPTITAKHVCMGCAAREKRRQQAWRAAKQIAAIEWLTGPHGFIRGYTHEDS